MSDCIFCESVESMKERGVYIAENELAYGRWDAFPVVEGHALIIPKRHTPDYFSLTPYELLAIYDLTMEIKDFIMLEDPSVKGFNVGWNISEVGGQSVRHAHQHLIPRRKGDVENPKGGIRNIIPGRGDYSNWNPTDMSHWKNLLVPK